MKWNRRNTWIAMVAGCLIFWLLIALVLS